LTVADAAAEALRVDVFRLLNLKLKLSLAAAILKALLLCDVKRTATTIARGRGINLTLSLKHLQQKPPSRP
jgi:hypothetical protein